MGYNIDRPLLFYSRELLEKEGYEILSIEWNDSIKTRYDQVSELLDKIEFDEYEDVIFVSKSIGTEISSAYVVNHNLRVRQIWYTPLQGTFDVCSGDIEEESIIAFIGTNDERSNVYQIKIKAEQLNIELHVYDDCDHSLECKDDSKNQEVLDDVIKITCDFVISERITLPAILYNETENYQLYRQIGFIEEIQRIYNKQKGTGDYAKDNVKTIIFGYGKTGI